MIKVDNNAEKRVFHLLGKENEPDFIKLKNEIIEIIRNENYSNLTTLSTKTYANQFSVFVFYEKIQSEISKITNPIIKTKLESLDWFKVLVGSFEEIKELIQDNEFILAQRNPELAEFKEYKEIFKNLYEKNLSNIKATFKKPFFELFEDLNVCPYCNRNFINPIYKNHSVGEDNKNQSPDIEHFFPKSIYPFLSLSISNLLPSCAFCNKIKSDVDTFRENCLSPYEIKNSDFRFDFTLDLNQVKKVKLISTTDCKNSKILHLESLYNEVHRKYINEIFDDVLKYPKSYYDKSLKNFKLTESDYKKVFRNYYKEEDFNKQPLSKMTKDLYNQINNLTVDSYKKVAINYNKKRNYQIMEIIDPISL